MNVQLLFIHALSPLHPGTGQGVGVIDLPVAREKATGLPYLPGSSVKGVLRDACTADRLRQKIFGPDYQAAHEHAGTVQFSDQRLVLLPVRSLAGTFAWVTAPFVLSRLRREAALVNGAGAPPEIPQPQETGALVAPGAETTLVIELEADRDRKKKIVLEDLDLDYAPDEAVGAWAEWLGKRLFSEEEADWRKFLGARLCVVHDNLFGYLSETATEVFPRIRLQEETKTVAEGGFWYEEALPAETVLAGLVVATPVKAAKITVPEIFDHIDELAGRVYQFGGGATVGRGLCRLRLVGGN